MKKLLMYSALCAATLGLSGCFGDSDDSAAATPPATASVPDSASASVDGFIAYLEALVASAADTLEPVDVSNVTPPTSDTTEPAKVD